MKNVTKDFLLRHYVTEELSVAQIAERTGWSQGKINYWLQKFKIKKRSISDANYIRANPDGDPFSSVPVKNVSDAFLMGMGIGLYWGEGTKRSTSSVRLGNTDPHLIRVFLQFLKKRYAIDETRLRFGIQIFSDMNVKREERFWQVFLGVPNSFFYKTIITRTGSIGTYRQKSQHGVLTVYFHNRKLRDMLMSEIERMSNFS